MTRMLCTDGTSAEVLEAFEGLSQSVYASDPVWAPESESAIAACLEDSEAGLKRLHAVVATRQGRAVARAMAILDRDPGDPVGGEGWVGLFECDAVTPEAGVEALSECEEWLRSAGAVRVTGPRTDSLRAGLLVGGFDRPHTIFTAHNPPFYLQVFRAAGYEVSTRMFSFVFTRDRVPKFRGRVSGGVRIRHPDLHQLDEEVARIERFQGSVFGGGIGHVRRDTRGARRLVARLLPILDLDLVTLAEDDLGGVVGVLICLPDAWQRKSPVDRARLVSVGVLPEWRGHGVAMAMGRALTAALLAKGYQSLEGSWVLESNLRAQLLALALGAEPGREFALLEKRL